MTDQSATGAHRAFSQGFYPDLGYDFIVRCVLGGAGYGAAEPGEVLATIDGVPAGDNEQWCAAWSATADRVQAEADAERAAGHAVSAASAYLRAASYFSVAVDACSALGDEAGLLATFRRHRAAWDGFVDAIAGTLGGPKVERVAIAYEDTTLPGYLFRPSGATSPRPTLVMVNGSDGAISSMWTFGASGALERGYNVLVFDGPGQQSMLFERGVGFRPDWEAVLTPVVDFLLTCDDVDPDRLAVWGISQAGFWVPRALVHEHRFAVAVADPGVVDVAASWTAHFPEPLLELFRSGDRESFDREMAAGMASVPEAAQNWAFRARPYGKDGYFDTLTEVFRYTLPAADAGRIRTPLAVADPEREQFWPGQSGVLADRVTAPVTVLPFTAAEGADYHCQPMGRKLTDARVFGWLAAELK